MSIRKIIQKIGVLFVLGMLFSVSFVQAGSVSKSWNFIVTGRAVDEGSSSFGEASFDTSLYSDFAGLTPDSPFYFVDTLFDPFQSSESLAQEKLGEMHTMISEGEYADAGVASEQYLDSVQRDFTQDLAVADGVEEFLHDEEVVYSHDAVVDIMKEILLDAVVEGKITEDEAAATGIDIVQEHVIESKQIVIETREEYVAETAAEEGITTVEADLLLQDTEAASPVGFLQEEELSEGLYAAGEAYVELREEIEVFIEGGDVSPEDALALHNMVDQIEISLEESVDAYGHGFIGDAYDEFATVEDLLLLADEIVANPDTYEEYIPTVEQHVEEVQTEREEEAIREFEDYETAGDSLKERYPERAEEIDRAYEQQKRIVELTEKMKDEFGTLYQGLVDEGKTPQEASEEMARRFDEEYLRVYGEPFHPPGIWENEITDIEREIEIIPIGDIDYELQQERAEELSGEYNEELFAFYEQRIAEGKTEQEANMDMGKYWDELYREVYGEPYTPPGIIDSTLVNEEIQAAPEDEGSFFFQYEDGEIVLDEREFLPVERGGFVKDYDYYDPVSGYTYVFTDTGYVYETFLGEEYEVVYEDWFDPTEELDGFEVGTEVYTYEAVVDGEPVLYEYTATGYTVTDAEGELVDTEVYSEGSYETVSEDAEIEIDTFGFEVNPVGGDSVIYEYSPEFKNYVSTTGQVYVPPGQAAYHYGVIDYEGGMYTYESGAVTWSYDPTVGVWTSDAGEVYTPYVTSVAPTGYEHYGSYESDSGKAWTYDDITGEWSSDAGDTWAYYHDEGAWRNPDTGVSYNPALSYQTYYYNEYYDSSEQGSSGTEYTYNYEGVTWTFDEDSYSWVSDTENVYYAPDTSYTFGYEDYSSEQDYSYSYYGYSDSYSSESSSAWTYDSSSGAWTSGEETYYTPTSSYYYAPSYYDTSSSGSSETGYTAESWNYDSTTGSWVSSSGETHSPSYSTYTWSSSDAYSSYYTSADSSGTSTSSSSGTYTAPTHTDSTSSGSHSSESYSSGGSTGGSTGGDSGGSSSGGSTSSGGDTGGGSYTGYFFLNLYKSFR